MRQISSDFIKRYRRVLDPWIDPIDWGYRTKGDTPHPVRNVTNERYGIGLSSGCRKPLTDRWLREHLAGGETCYYLSRRGRPHKNDEVIEGHNVGLVLIDVDAHEGQTDAMEATLELRARFFPRSYVEPSTNGQGGHLYVPISYEGTFAAKFRLLCLNLANALNVWMKDYNWDETVDVCGTPSTLHYDEHTPEEWFERTHFATQRERSRLERLSFRTKSRDINGDLVEKILLPVGIKSRGQLGKLPRLQNGLTDLHRLEALVPQPLSTMVEPIRWAMLEEDWHRSRDYGWKPPQLKGATAARFLEERLSSIDRDQAGGQAPRQAERADERVVTLPNECVTRRSSEAAKLAAAKASTDARERVRTAATVLARRFGRPPLVEEVLEFYSSQGLGNQRSEHPARVRRACEEVEWVRRTFDPRKAVLGFSDRLESLLSAIDQHVRPEHFGKTSWKTSISRQDLALCLYAVERVSFSGVPNDEWRWTLPTTFLKGLIRELRDEGLRLKGYTNRGKVAAVKDVLERAGLIRCVDRGYLKPTKGRGVSQRWHIDSKHPRYPEFVRLVNRHPHRFRSFGNGYSVHDYRLRDEGGEVTIATTATLEVRAPGTAACCR